MLFSTTEVIQRFIFCDGILTDNDIPTDNNIPPDNDILTNTMIERKEGHEPRIREVNMHLQLAYRMWQKNKLPIFESELGTAVLNIKYLRDLITDQQKLALMTEHISNAKAAAVEKNGEKVREQLSKAIALSEKMLRLLPK